jgi:hypothetical protein
MVGVSLSTRFKFFLRKNLEKIKIFVSCVCYLCHITLRFFVDFCFEK